MSSLSRLLDQGRTPSEWVKALATKGLHVSERELRRRANAISARIKIGRDMLITPEQIDTILESESKCHSNHIVAAPSGGHVEGLNIMARRSRGTTDKALEHLRKQALGNGAGKKKSGS